MADQRYRNQYARKRGVELGRFPHRPRKLSAIAALLCVSAVLTGCSDDLEPGGARLPQRPHFAVNTAACGVQYTSVEATYDSVLAVNGMPLVVDTSDVCETWTGIDYDYRIDFTGRGSWEADTDPDTEAALEFQAKTLVALDASGAQIGTAIQLPVTGLDFVKADSATRDAIADDPYFGLRAIDQCEPDPGELRCSYEAPGETNILSGADATVQRGVSTLRRICEDPGIICAATGSGASMARVIAQGGGTAPLVSVPNAQNWSLAQVSTDENAYARHGLRRPGVRALINAGEEIGRASNGRRQFRVPRNGGATTYQVHPVAGLLMAQDWSDPEGRGHWEYFWRLVDGGYVLDRIEMEQRDRNPDGTEIPSRSIQLIANLKVQ